MGACPLLQPYVRVGPERHTFNNSLFGKIDMMLTKPYYLYQKSPKRYRELKELSEVYNETIPKPLKAGGTCWIDYRY